MAQMTALQQYAVVTVVVSGFAFSGLVAFDHVTLREEMSEDFIQIGGFSITGGSLIVIGLVGTVGACISCGLYATLIFTFCSIYGTTAIAKGNREAFENFMKNTVQNRIYAFIGFKISFCSMALSLFFIFASKLEAWLTVLAGSTGTLVFIFAMREASAVMAAATTYIFAPPPSAVPPEPPATFSDRDVEEGGSSDNDDDGSEAGNSSVRSGKSSVRDLRNIRFNS